MKTLKSLMFREMKLTRKHYILMLVLLLLTELFLLIPFLAVLAEKNTAGDGDLTAMRDTASALGLILASAGGAVAGLNNGTQKADISVGWKRYAFVLPPNSVQLAASALLVKLTAVLATYLLTETFAAVTHMIVGGNLLLSMQNAFLLTASFCICLDTVYCFILMLARDRHDLKKYGIIAGIAAAAVYVLITHSGIASDMRSDSGFDMAASARLAARMCTGGFTAVTLLVFVCICAVYFFVMHRMYKRREP